MKLCNVLLLAFVCACAGFGQEPPAPGKGQEAKCGEGQLGPLVTATRNEDAAVRRAATDTLGQLGNEAMHAVLDYTKLLNDEILPRLSAAFALVDCGGEAKTIVPALTAALKDKDADVRYEATTDLGRLGREAETAIPNLTELLKDESEPIRKAAAESLQRIKAGKKQSGGTN